MLPEEIQKTVEESLTTLAKEFESNNEQWKKVLQAIVDTCNGAKPYESILDDLYKEVDLEDEKDEEIFCDAMNEISSFIDGSNHLIKEYRIQENPDVHPFHYRIQIKGDVENLILSHYGKWVTIDQDEIMHLIGEE